MTDVKIVKNSHMRTEELEKLLNIDHIHQHLIKVGLINKYGEIVSKEEYQHLHKSRSRRRHTSYKNMESKQIYQTFIQRPITTINKKQSRQLKSLDYHSISPSRYKNKSQSPKRLSSPNQSSTCIKNISVCRAVNPKIILINDRCLITIIYYGPQIIIDYERNWFEPDGDEIIVMQQHCGGENLIVYKGALKPNETFQFESRRHSNYPFALTFYVHGLIDNRLSICCESRYKHNVRIGGKRGLFGIINVQNSKACRRCRFEQRMKRLAELKAQKISIRSEISTPSPNITRSPTPDLTMNLKEQEKSLLLNHVLDITNSNLIEEKIPNQTRRLSNTSTDDGRILITNHSNTYIEKAFPKISRKTNTDE